MTAKAEFARRFDVRPDTLDRLDHYATMIERWNGRINLFGRGTIGDLWDRHISDGARLAELVPGETERICDLGSGGGVPGLLIAALRPESSVTLIDSDARKGAFLREAARSMSMTVTVVTERIERAPPMVADVVTARALAPLSVLLGYCHRHVRPGGSALLMKGRTWSEEVRQARHVWRFSHDVEPGTDDGVVLHVRNLEPR